jgi:hypothetical protein
VPEAEGDLQPEKETDHCEHGDDTQLAAVPWLSNPGKGAGRSVLHAGLNFVHRGTAAHNRWPR